MTRDFKSSTVSTRLQNPDHLSLEDIVLPTLKPALSKQRTKTHLPPPKHFTPHQPHTLTDQPKAIQNPKHKLKSSPMHIIKLGLVLEVVKNSYSFIHHLPKSNYLPLHITTPRFPFLVFLSLLCFFVLSLHLASVGYLPPLRTSNSLLVSVAASLFSCPFPNPPALDRVTKQKQKQKGT